MRVEYAGGVIELRKPTCAEVLTFEEARRALEAPDQGPLGHLDDGRDIIAACITNMAPDVAAAALRRYPGLIRAKLRAAFRSAGETGMGLEQDASAITHEHKKTFAGQDLVGLRCFGVQVVLRPIQPERYALMEKRAARAGGPGVPWPELASIGREHILAPICLCVKKSGDPDPACEQHKLLTEHPYLAPDLGALLYHMASGLEEDMLGKLVPSSTTQTETSGKTPGSSSPPATGSGGTESAGQRP